ncbi:caspase family protein [Neotabrizicola sp. VNH66]|uniref:caspase family protein n=1 Tax=Neotabrizicola sp. VNH66 TaxID=3400918 RepID=UPI003C0944DE
MPGLLLRICLWIALCALPGLAAGEGRYALVIGIETYDSARDLVNPVADAMAVAGHLRDLDFIVTTETNRDKRRLRRALEDFAQDAAGADLALVYYAGHGVEIGRENRLLPTDAAMNSVEALRASSVSLAEVVETLRRTAPAAILLVDACRNDPFEGTPLADLSQRAAKALEDQSAPQLSPGFGRVGRADGLVYAFATAPGATAEDGRGPNSPFAEAILRHLGTPGLELRGALSLIQQDVYDRTRGKQLPYVESALPDLIFVSGTPGAVSERDRLLLAMAGLAPETRAEVERVAAADDLPLAPLYAALLAAGELTATEREATLAEAARQYRRFQNAVAALDGADTAVSALRDEAARLMDLGAYREAQEKLQAAADLDAAGIAGAAELLLTRSLSQVETLRISALAAEAALDYPTALARWREISATLTRLEPLGLPEEALLTQTTALWWEGYLLIRLGEGATAVPVYEDWNRRAAARAAAHPASTALQHDLANSLRELGNLLHRRGQTTRAREMLTGAQDIWRRLSEAEPQDPVWLRHLGFTQTDLGNIALTLNDLPAAEASFRRGLDIWQRLTAADMENPDLRNDLSVGHERLGRIFYLTGNLAGAEAEYLAVLDLRLTLAGQMPDKALFQANLSVAHFLLAQVRLQMGDTSPAEASARAALDIRRMLAEKDPADAGRQADLAASLEQLANILRAKGDLAGAVAEYTAALMVLDPLIGQDTGVLGWLDRKKTILDNRGFAQVLLGDLAAAESDYRAALALVEALISQNPETAYLRHNLAVSYTKLGQNLLDQGHWAEAGGYFQTAIDTLEALNAAGADQRLWPQTLARSHVGLGDAMMQQGDLAAAKAHYQRGLELRLALSQDDPADADLRDDLALSYSRLGEVLEAEGDPAGAEKAYAMGLDHRRALVAQDPLSRLKAMNLAVAQGRLCELLRKAGDFTAAEPYCRDRLTGRRALLALTPEDTRAREQLAEALAALGRVLRETGRLGDAEDLFREELALRLDLAAADPGGAEPQRALAWACRRITGILRQRGADPALIARYNLAEMEAWLRVEARLGYDAEADEEIMTVFFRMEEDQPDTARVEQDVLALLLRLRDSGELTEDRAQWIEFMQGDPAAGDIVVE